MPTPEDSGALNPSDRLFKLRDLPLEDDFANDFSKISVAKWDAKFRPRNLRHNPVGPIIEVTPPTGKENRSEGPGSLLYPLEPDQAPTPGQILEHNAKRFSEKDSRGHSTDAMDQFTLILQVGRGAFATVFKAENKATKQVLAIKQIRLDPSDDVEAMMGEIDLLKILNHRNIVKYHGFIKSPHVLNILLEYCAGGLLRLRYRQLGHGFSESKTAQYARLILNGLQYLHLQGVVHRDVKAANVLLTHDGEIKLADFGVAASVCAQHATLVGTPNWIAPEIILGGERLCTASDVWLFGATVIELLTTFPPYHDLNSMAALHAIVVDDYPPIPACLAQCRNFLLECFQKLPLLRPSADVLLKHRWLQPKERKGGHGSREKVELPPVTEPNESLAPISVRRPLSDFCEDGEQTQNWEIEFLQANPNHQFFSQKRDLLKEYAEPSAVEEWDISELSQKVKSKAVPINDTDIRYNLLQDETDPFTNADFVDIDTAEVKAQGKLAELTAKLSGCAASLHRQDAGAAEFSTNLVKRISYLINKHPELLDVLVRDHGVLTLLEMLGTAHNFPREQRLWLYVLATLNCIFARNIALFESFCLLGGIPCVTQFAMPRHSLKVRVQVARFIGLFCHSTSALHMFVSCGGIAVLARMLALDALKEPASIHALLVECIHAMLCQDLARSKSDLCWILSKHGVLHWLVTLLCVKVSNIAKTNRQETVARIMAIIAFFSNSEARVRRNICTSELLRHFVSAFPGLEFEHQLTALRFFKLVLCVPQLLTDMYNADMLRVLIKQLNDNPPTNPNFQEVVNIVCPTLYNCCYLSYEREIEIVNMGAVPLYARLAQLRFSFRQFVLPILCEFARCGPLVHFQLHAHGVRQIYFDLLLDPYWQANALDAIVHWDQQNPAQAAVETPAATSCFVKAFLLLKVSNIESALDSFLQLAVRHAKVALAMVQRGVCSSILQRLEFFQKNAVLQLALLRILKVLVVHARASTNDEDRKNISQVAARLEKTHGNSSLVLVSQLVTEIVGLACG